MTAHNNLNLDGPIEESKDISILIADQLNGLKIPDLPHDKRVQVAMACQHIAIEHAQAIIFLVDDGYYGPALALQRPMFEALARGVWLKYSARDEELDKAMRGKFPRINEIVGSDWPPKKLHDNSPLEALKATWWKRLCDYTHTGPYQIRSRLDNTGLRSNYQQEDVIALLRWSDMVHLFSALELALAANKQDLITTLFERMDAYKGTPY